MLKVMILFQFVHNRESRYPNQQATVNEIL